MARKMAIMASVLILGFGLGVPSFAEVMLGTDLKIPPHYTPGKDCRAGRGYHTAAQGPNYPTTMPKMDLKVFKGEVIGFIFEADAKEGWKPWYDQPEGQPTSHDGGPKHYTQTIMIKKGPTAEECKASKGPLG